MADLQTVEQALARVLERITPLEEEPVAVDASTGRTLVRDVCAVVDLPPFASSAMDGFALRSADTPGTLPVELRVAAGSPALRGLVPGEAMGISTGGVVPDGADAVVPLEHVHDHGATVEVPHAVAAGANVRPRGGDATAGSIVLSAGQRLGPHRLAAAAAAGVAHLPVARRPRVAILSTGTELRAPGEVLGPGQVYESNGAMLSSLFGEAGAVVERLQPVVDDVDTHRAALERALDADVVVTSGGVSVGPHDLVRSVSRELGVEEVFWGVAMRPGKPLAFGVRGRTLVFGLPGNPVSSLVGALLFVVPALRSLQGDPDPAPRFLVGLLGRELARDAHRDDYVRARVDGGDECVLHPVVGQESHMIVNAAAADAIVHVPRGDGSLAEGARVRYLPLARPSGA